MKTVAVYVHKVQIKGSLRSRPRSHTTILLYTTGLNTVGRKIIRYTHRIGSSLSFPCLANHESLDRNPRLEYLVKGSRARTISSSSPCHRRVPIVIASPRATPSLRLPARHRDIQLAACIVTGSFSSRAGQGQQRRAPHPRPRITANHGGMTPRPSRGPRGGAVATDPVALPPGRRRTREGRCARLGAGPAH